MVRIGIIGTESSHAMGFARYFNLQDPKTGRLHYPDMQVTAVYGDEKSNGAIVREIGTMYIAQHPQDMIGRVDAVVITARRGSDHLKYCLPFLSQGLPLFIDKPFTSDPVEADELARLLEKSNCPVLGGSGCRLANDVQQLAVQVAGLREKEKLLGAALNFQVMVDSEYDGFYFYAPHLVEICLEIFGTDINSVIATRTAGNVTAVVDYDAFAVSLHFCSWHEELGCLLITPERNWYRAIDTTGIIAKEANDFAQLIRGERASAFPKDLARPIHIIDAIQKSYTTGQKIYM